MDIFSNICKNIFPNKKKLDTKLKSLNRSFYWLVKQFYRILVHQYMDRNIQMFIIAWNCNRQYQQKKHLSVTCFGKFSIVAATCVLLKIYSSQNKEQCQFFLLIQSLFCFPLDPYPTINLSTSFVKLVKRVHVESGRGILRN